MPVMALMGQNACQVIRAGAVRQDKVLMYPMGFIDVCDGLSCVKRNELYSATAHVEDFSAARHTGGRLRIALQGVRLSCPDRIFRRDRALCSIPEQAPKRNLNVSARYR